MSKYSTISKFLNFQEQLPQTILKNCALKNQEAALIADGLRNTLL